jgi:hypothetical protein
MYDLIIQSVIDEPQEMENTHKETSSAELDAQKLSKYRKVTPRKLKRSLLENDSLTLRDEQQKINPPEVKKAKKPRKPRVPPAALDERAQDGEGRLVVEGYCSVKGCICSRGGEMICFDEKKLLHNKKRK